MKECSKEFDFEEFQRANEALAKLADKGINSELGWSIRRDAELLVEALKYSKSAAKKYAEKIFWEAYHSRGYQDLNFKDVGVIELYKTCMELAESVRPLAEISHNDAP